jgi:DNA mismatch endonuclease, patch repair protein
MRRVKSKNTRLELTVRKALHGAGFRYRLHDRRLPGHPDLVFPSRRSIVFVHGCFWHRHEGCKRASVPGTNKSFWIPKLEKNAARDAATDARLRELGWSVHVVWECEIRNASYWEPLIRFLSREANEG